MPHVRHVHLRLHIAVSLKSGTTHIRSFGYVVAYATAIGCAGFRLSFGKIIVL